MECLNTARECRQPLMELNHPHGDRDTHNVSEPKCQVFWAAKAYKANAWG